MVKFVHPAAEPSDGMFAGIVAYSNPVVWVGAFLLFGFTAHKVYKMCSRKLDRPSTSTTPNGAVAGPVAEPSDDMDMQTFSLRCRPTELELQTVARPSTTGQRAHSLHARAAATSRYNKEQGHPTAAGQRYLDFNKIN